MFSILLHHVFFKHFGNWGHLFKLSKWNSYPLLLYVQTQIRKVLGCLLYFVFMMSTGLQRKWQNLYFLGLMVADLKSSTPWALTHLELTKRTKCSQTKLWAGQIIEYFDLNTCSYKITAPLLPHYYSSWLLSPPPIIKSFLLFQLVVLKHRMYNLRHQYSLPTCLCCSLRLIVQNICSFWIIGAARKWQYF